MIKLPEIERKSKEEIKAFQNELLKKQLVYLQENSTYYSELFKAQKIYIE